MRPRHLLSLLVCAVLPLTAAGQALDARVQSMKAMRDSGVVRQQFDYSCGSAALATLLTYGLNDPVDEPSVLAAITSSLTEEGAAAMQARGLSLLELAAFAQSRGYRAQGFRIPADQLARVGRPVIVFIKPWGYDHFAVFKGVRGDRVYLADPSLGNVRMPLYRFLAMWADESGRGVVLAVDPVDRSWPQRFALELN